jgi:hypothetical protein
VRHAERLIYQSLTRKLARTGHFQLVPDQLLACCLMVIFWQHFTASISLDKGYESIGLGQFRRTNSLENQYVHIALTEMFSFQSLVLPRPVNPWGKDDLTQIQTNSEGFTVS